jgi:glycosyltransferase involved in cell wall biosynthesis
MNLATLKRDTPLLQFASRAQDCAYYCFFPSSSEPNSFTPGFIEALPNIVYNAALSDLTSEKFAAQSTFDAWKEDTFWEQPNLPTADNKVRIAVFGCDLSSIPFRAVGALRSLRFSKIIFLVNDTWHYFNSASLSGSLGLSLWRGKRMAGRAQYKVTNVLRRAALKRFAVDLREAGASEFTPESGKAFTTSVPFLLDHADGSGVERSTLMLFEESTLLSPHHPHDAVRTIGGGRYSLWNENLYFSSTDGSDPRTNRRRYRYLVLNDTTKRLQKLFGAPLATPSDESSCSPPSVGFQSLGRVRSGQSATELAQRMASDEVRSYPDGAACNDEVGIFITNLGPGGAERQMTYLAQGLKGRGEAVRCFTYFQSAPETLHYKPILEESGVPVDFMTTPHVEFIQRVLSTARGADDARLIAGLPADLSEEVFSLYTHLVVTKPKVLHCWLDQSNLIGAVAGWLAGVPQILLSSRSVNPTHFPHIIKDWYQEWYKIVSKCPRVAWVANSSVGAKSYAEWSEYPVEKIPVVSNGLDLESIKVPTPDACAEFRESVGIPLSAPVVTAVFRMSHEKRPLRFVRLIWELKKRFPTMHAIIAGIGPMEDMVRREIDNLKLNDTLHLIGKRSDVPLVMRSSDVVVLCSSIEGSPNVLIEAGWLGRPVVTTQVGDVDKIVSHGSTGFICERDSFTPLLERTSELLANSTLRESFGAAARNHISQRFSIEKMVDGMSKALKIENTSTKDRLCA